MNHNERKWFLAGVLITIFGVSALAAVAWLGWAIYSARTNPNAPPSAPIVEVVTYYPGMPASAIEKTITNRIERWVNQAPGVRAIESRSLAGVSIVHVFFRKDIDVNSALVTTSELALGTLPTLPPNTLPPVVFPPSSSRPVGVLTVHGAAVSEGELKDMARIEVRNWLGVIKGAVAPVVLGGKDRIVVVHLKPAEMKAHRLSAADVVEAIKKENKTAATGIVYFGDDQLLIDSIRAADQIKELMDLPIRAEPGNNVFLRDIGRIESSGEPQTVVFRIDAQRAVGVPVYPQAGAPPAMVRDAISKELHLWKERMPPKIKLRWAPFGMAGNGEQDDDGLLTIYVRAPSNSRLAETEKHIAAVEHFLETSIPAKEREALLSELGIAPDWSAAWTANAGPMDATIYVQLSRDRTLSAAAYASTLRRLWNDEAGLAELEVRFYSRDMPAPVDIRITGGKDEEAMRLAQEVRRRLRDIKGAVDVVIPQRRNLPQIIIHADSKKAAALELSGRDVLTRTAAALKSRVSLESIWTDSNTGDLCLAVPMPDNSSVLEDVVDTVIKGGKAAEPIKLSSLATLQRTFTAVEIDHVNQARVFDVRTNIQDRGRRDVIADIRKMLEELKLPEGMRVDLVGGDAASRNP